jgi:hypothetical protein
MSRSCLLGVLGPGGRFVVDLSGSRRQQRLLLSVGNLNRRHRPGKPRRTHRARSRENAVPMSSSGRMLVALALASLTYVILLSRLIATTSPGSTRYGPAVWNALRTRTRFP